jgi:hypothetical protein
VGAMRVSWFISFSFGSDRSGSATIAATGSEAQRKRIGKGGKQGKFWSEGGSTVFLRYR